MDIDARKISFIQKFTRLQNEDSLKMFELLLEIENQNLQPMTHEEYKSQVKEGLEDYKAGRTTSTENFQKEVKNWK